MRKIAARHFALALIPLVAACAAPAAKAPGTVAQGRVVVPQLPQVQPQTAFRPARIMTMPGLEAVIGSDAGGLVRQFGTPRLDVWEADARKLQFAGTACILDVFLYPAAQGRTETATWVEARRQTDGKAVDRAACVAALKR